MSEDISDEASELATRLMKKLGYTDEKAFLRDLTRRMVKELDGGGVMPDRRPLSAAEALALGGVDFSDLVEPDGKFYPGRVPAERRDEVSAAWIDGQMVEISHVIEIAMERTIRNWAAEEYVF